jgi:hypothetical protein
VRSQPAVAGHVPFINYFVEETGCISRSHWQACTLAAYLVITQQRDNLPAIVSSLRSEAIEEAIDGYSVRATVHYIASLYKRGIFANPVATLVNQRHCA